MDEIFMSIYCLRSNVFCHAVRLYSVVLFFMQRYQIPLHLCSKEPKNNFCVTSVLAKTLLLMLLNKDLIAVFPLFELEHYIFTYLTEYDVNSTVAHIER